MLTTQQLATLAAAILAEPAVATFVTNGQDNAIADYFNGPHATEKAWRSEVSKADLFAAMNITQFDGLTAGKRDAWRLLMDFAPVDFRKGKMRACVTDVWAAGTATSILTDCTRAATRAEALFGGTDRTDGSVTAKVLEWEGMLTSDDVSKALRP